MGVNSEIFKTHPDWLAKDGEGPWLIDNPNYGKYGVLDASVPAARDYLESTARKFREAGYRYCFTDFVDELALRPEQSHNPQLTRAEVARLAFEALSKGFGEDFYYLSQHSSFANLGLMQSMRVTQDSFGDKVATYRDAMAFWDIYQHLLMPYASTDEKFIGYRIDQLDPEKSYRIGILPFAATPEPTAAKLILRRVSDGKEFVLTDRILFKYPPHSPQEYQVLWFDVPAEAIDPAGVLLEVRKESGPRVSLSELWLLSK